VHELGLCEGILEAVERRAAGRRVTGVRLRVGTLHRVVEPALDQAFELVAGGTVAEGATVEVVTVPVRVACGACGEVTEADDLPAVCPACGAGEPDCTGGDELVLESITLHAPA
jgi:hydrogenase nickel incorporation protein HypA/HybF